MKLGFAPGSATGCQADLMTVHHSLVGLVNTSQAILLIIRRRLQDVDDLVQVRRSGRIERKRESVMVPSRSRFEIVRLAFSKPHLHS